MTDYQLAKKIVSEMEMGQVKKIDTPLKVNMFRHYLTVEGQKQNKQFTTKRDGKKLLVARVEKRPF